MKLSDINIGQKAVILKVAGSGSFRRRIVEMGFVKGKVVEVVTRAPLGDPIEYAIMDYHVSLRKSEACHIEVISLQEAEAIAESRRDDKSTLTTVSEEEIYRVALEHRREIKVALVGNPNAGKTSLFNAISGSHEKVGNYSGVTVDAKSTELDYKGYHIRLVDLPGTYSISAYSPEERYVRSHIVDRHPDVIVNVVDSGNLERNLFLTTQLIDMNIRMVIALNMYDDLEKKGNRFDYDSLSAMIGVPMIPTVSTNMRGVDVLLDEVIKLYEESDDVSLCKVRHIHINYGTVIENTITKIKTAMKNVGVDPNPDYTPRYVAIRLLVNDPDIESFVKGFDSADEIFKVRDACIATIKAELKDSPENLIGDAKYGFIAGALKETFFPHQRTKGKSLSSKIDAVVTNRFLGYPIFLAALFIMFQATFVLGAYPMEWIESGVAWLADSVRNLMAPGVLRDLLVDGIIHGAGGVLVFLPNILILFLFISFMEYSGYMARAAFIMDRIMHYIGLHGRSFIPLIMGFGCNVPAIMATRTIENRNARMITILISPLMSCSARLPIYILFVSIFFRSHAAIALFAIYMAGILLAALMARLFKSLFFAKEEIPFVMELPPYRIPTLKVVIRDTWDKAVQYLRKIGTTILVGSVIIWALSYFPMYKGVDYHQLSPEQKIEQTENSYLGRLGKAIQPVMAPLGFDWKCSVSLLSGITAKEIVISTLGILYNADDDTQALSQRLEAELKPDGSQLFTPALALSFMLFVLIYFPCVATIITIRHETGSWKWAAFSAVYSVLLAWIVAFVVYQSITLNIWQELLAAIIVAISLYMVISRIVKRFRNKTDGNNCSSCGAGSCAGCPMSKK